MKTIFTSFFVLGLFVSNVAFAHDRHAFARSHHFRRDHTRHYAPRVIHRVYERERYIPQYRPVYRKHCAPRFDFGPERVDLYFGHDGFGFGFHSGW